MSSKGRRKASNLVKLAFIGTPLFFSGCADTNTVVVERRVADNVDVVVEPRPGFHYSYYYGGYVPIIVPIGGYIGPGYYSGGYRAPRTTVNRYVTTHKTVVVKPPASSTTTKTTTTTTTSKPSTGTSSTVKSSTSTSVRSGAAAPSGGGVKSGGFGATGRGGSVGG